MTRVEGGGGEGGWQQLKLPLRWRGGESIILGFCLTHFDQNGRGHRHHREKGGRRRNCPVPHTLVTPSSLRVYVI